MPNVTVNYLAVVVAALAAWILGALWYSPALFGKQWAAAQGFTPERMETMRQGMARKYLVTLVCLLIMAWVMAAFIDRMGILGAIGGVKLGGVVWLGFVATTGLTAQQFSGKPTGVFVIEVAYQLVYMVLMGVILAVWR